MEQSKLPMIELHLHLDGAIPPETMWALAQEKGVPMPAETLEGFQHWLVETSDCADVNTYLARFELPLQLMQDIVKIKDSGGHILDPFAGSGTTVLAAVLEGYSATGIEMSDVYADLAKERIKTELEKVA